MNKLVPKKALEDIVERVELSAEEIADAVVSVGPKAIAMSIPGFDKIFGVIETVNNELRDRKLNLLLQDFHSKMLSAEETMARLKAIFSEPQGVILFGKIMSILNNGNQDEEWIKLLSNALKHISDANIKDKFQELEFVLAQIARLSPQALVILSKGDKWHTVKFTGSTTTSGVTVSGDWDKQVARHFAHNVGIAGDDETIMIAHSFQELESMGMIYKTPDKTLGCTQVGARVQVRIS